MTEFQQKLRRLMHQYVTDVYSASISFPKEEIYGVTSQFRRSSLSIILNYIEGSSRLSRGYKRNLFEIAYGSLQESKYLVDFSYTQEYITEVTYTTLLSSSEEIGKMLWSELSKFKK